MLKDSINTFHIVKAVCGMVPANTQFNKQWAERNFTAWVIQRNANVYDDPIPLDLLSSHDPVWCLSIYSILLWRHITLMQSCICQQQCDHC